MVIVHMSCFASRAERGQHVYILSEMTSKALAHSCLGVERLCRIK